MAAVNHTPPIKFSIQLIGSPLPPDDPEGFGSKLCFWKLVCFDFFLQKMREFFLISVIYGALAASAALMIERMLVLRPVLFYEQLSQFYFLVKNLPKSHVLAVYNCCMPTAKKVHSFFYFFCFCNIFLRGVHLIERFCP
jgi:hypothetical protein